MGDSDLIHRPLMAGIEIKTRTPGHRERNDSGTLTGLATRNTDGKRVLVTNLHV